MPGSTHSQDQPMADANPPDANPLPEPDTPDLAEIEALDKGRIQVLPGGNEYASSFQIEGEDHTLGNALRYIIMKNPDVEFCGYTIPHPSEAKMNLRIQTYERSITAVEAFEKGLDDLMDLCDVVGEKFEAARDEFDANPAKEG